MWFYCNDNAAKRDFQSQTAYSQFGMDIVKRSGIIYYKWPNIKRESLDASIIWFWTNSQGTGDWDVMIGRHGNANATKRDFSNATPWYE